MSDVGQALKTADQLVEELKGGAYAKSPSNTRLKRMSYTHDALIDLIIEHPELDQNEFAAAFGYTPGWISTIIASDAFQTKLAHRRDEIIDPAIKASIEERFRALVVRSLEVLQAKLNAPQVSDNVALRAAELGAKALGVGGHAPPKPAQDDARLEKLAERLLILQSNVRERVVNGEVLAIETKPQGS